MQTRIFFLHNETLLTLAGMLVPEMILQKAAENIWISLGSTVCWVSEWRTSSPTPISQIQKLRHGSMAGWNSWSAEDVLVIVGLLEDS